MSDELLLDDDVVEGVEIYEGPPDHSGPDRNQYGLQDDAVPFGTAFSLAANFTSSPRDYEETLEWYRTHQTAAQIGFDPDGYCLKVCRTARNIPVKFETARLAMLATPNEHRIHEVRKLRRSMVLYYADPNDGNTADHIVTMIGRVKGFDPDSLRDVLVETNSVKANELVVVRGDYFYQHWGDPFVFGATWLNGVELDVPQPKTKVEKFHDTAPRYDLRILARAGKNGRPKAQKAYDAILSQVKQLPDNPKFHRVREFKNQALDDKIVDLRILDKAVESGLKYKVKSIRDEIRRLIKSLPDE